MIREIKTERLLLRPFTMDDLDGFHALRGDAEVMRYISTPAARTHGGTRERLSQVMEQYDELGFGFFAVVRQSDERLIGWCGLAPLDTVAEIEIGYGFAPDCWGQGYATEAARATIKFGFEDLGLARIVAVAYSENVGSTNVMKKLGMTYIHVGRYWGADLVRYDITGETFSGQRIPSLT